MRRVRRRVHVRVFYRPVNQLSVLREGPDSQDSRGGTQPLWASTGRELFYRRPAELMTVPGQTESSFTPGNPEVVFEGPYFRVRPVEPTMSDPMASGS